MEIFKDPLPRGFSYALKPSVLELASVAAKLTTPIKLFQKHGGWGRDGPIFEATFHLPGSWMRNETDLVVVGSRSLASDQRRAAREYIEATVLPEFVAWLRNLEALPVNSTVWNMKQRFARTWEPPVEAD